MVSGILTNPVKLEGFNNPVNLFKISQNVAKINANHKILSWDI